MVAGFLFGLGWWLWIDAVVDKSVNAPAQVMTKTRGFAERVFLHKFIPGILATFATIIMNLVNK